MAAKDKNGKDEDEAPALTQPQQAGGDDDEGGGLPGWMATFADLVTLLMCFFVLLFAMSTTQEETFKELIQSLKSALGVQQIPEAGTREGLTMMTPPSDEEKVSAVDELGSMIQKELEEIVADVKELVMFNRLSGMVKVQETEEGAVITISDVVLFAPGDSTISPRGLAIMAEVAKVLKQFSYPIKIAGHTDNVPIHNQKFASNWELSANRASEVVRFLINQGISPRALTAEGYAEFRPVADNDTVFGRSQNRRVEIIYERADIEKSMRR